MASTRTKVIGTVTTSTILAVLLWFVNSINFDTQIDLNDIVCAGDFSDPCEANFNITSTKFTYYLYNKEGVDINFIPNVKEAFTCKRDGRFRASWRADLSHPNYAELNQAPCGIGWREFNFKDPLTPRYKYIEKFERGKKKEYKLVVFKFNPEDEIKWGGKITGEEFDPKFLPPFETITVCDTKTTEKKIDIIELQTRGRSHQYSHLEVIATEEFIVRTCSDEPINNSCSQETMTRVTETIRIYDEYEVNVTVGSYIEYKNKSVNCRLKTFIASQYQFECPIDYRCDQIKDEIWVMSNNDGDKNFRADESNGRGWDITRIKISDIKEGRIKISSYKEDYLEITKR